MSRRGKSDERLSEEIGHPQEDGTVVTVHHEKERLPGECVEVTRVQTAIITGSGRLVTA